ncbi:2-phytyl-1,4-beta-naphthoquinone methyltransferase, chloroplastic-like [Salvia splendens]|uniref:2-phytyl-1,4-beta-naphthoquinone methyltransferase, chloroplastic-like n=1 Tax=Salvia splendens TaxID=180675 RepID=UPI001C27B754|nr:2-phytyl-1,4-beta-naphthoquinone methyltransferase, chloroplastic-like [Salvia splendens]
MAALQFAFPSTAGSRRRPESRSTTRPARCTADRQALFNRIAPVYDNLNDLLSLGMHRVWKRMAVSWNEVREGDTAVDVCCGSGDLAFLLSEKVGISGKVIALDFSKEQLQIAATRQSAQSKACYKNIEWIEGDAADLPFPRSSFDAATIGYGLRNIVDRRKAMEEMYKVLKPGSKVSILDFNKSTSSLNSFSSSISCFFQDWMIDYIVVPIASGYTLADEYQYLKSSIKKYLTGKELEQLAREVGFSEAKFYEIGAGLMGNLVATR